MIVTELIINLALLAALTVFSGFIEALCPARRREHILQGLLFGSVAVIGMLLPLDLGAGLIFDGRSVILSLCGLFFGPLSVLIASVIALAGRVCLGGVGLTMGVLVIAESAAFGLLFRRWRTTFDSDVSMWQLFVLGLLVHSTMVLLMLFLPYDCACAALKKVGPSVLAIYPLAMVLLGKVLSDQRMRSRFTTDLKNSREEFRTTLYSIGDGIVTTDAQGLVRQVNPVAERLLGWTEAEARGRLYGDVFKLVNEKTREPVTNPIEQVLREGRGAELASNSVLLARGGCEFPITDCAAPIFGKDGAVGGAVLVFRDQTAERAAQRAVQVERDNLRTIMTASPVALVVLNESACVIDANPAAERLFDKKLSEMTDRLCGAFLCCAHSAADAQCGNTPFCATCVLRSALKEVLATGVSALDQEVEYVQCVQGEERRRWMVFSMAPVHLQGARRVLVALSDLTRHRQTEAALKRLEWMLSKKPARATEERDASGETAPRPGKEAAPVPGGLLQASISGEMLANIVSEFLDLLGSAAAILEADGTCAYKRFDAGWCRIFTAAAPPDSRHDLPAEWVKCSQDAMAAGQPADIAWLCGLRLYSVPIMMHGSVIGTIGFCYGDPLCDPDSVRELADKIGISFEVLLREAWTYDARPPYIIEMAKARLQTAAWLIGSFVEVRRAEAEHLKLEAQFRHAQKMEAVGRLAGGVAHDFNNILQGIIGYGELLAERLPESGEEQEFAREIVVEGKRAATLTRQLLAFARKQASDPRVLDLNDAVVATLKMLRRLLGEDIELSWTPAPQRCLAKVDPGQLEQILANLAVNSRDAIDGVGRISIDTRVVTLDETSRPLTPACKPGQYAQLTFSDTGSGMEPAVMEHLFEPFFTTKARGRGTGLGLATIYGIVEQSGGGISVSSSPGKGTVFKICFPEQEAAGVEVANLQPSDTQPSGTETVLIVDDEEVLLRSARRILEGLGYTVLSANNPEEAIRVAQSYRHEIHVLLTDVVMPGMSGRDLWLRLEALRPSMKCVYMSGYTANIIAQRGTLSANVRFLQKPFTKAALANRLREVLSATGG